MRNHEEKIKLKDYEFRDYKFNSKASKRCRRKMRKAAKLDKYKNKWLDTNNENE